MVKGDGKVKRGRPLKDVKMDRRLVVRIEPALLERINAAARAQGVSTGAWVRLAAAAIMDSPGDMARALVVDPSGERAQLVVRKRSGVGRRVGDGSPA